MLVNPYNGALFSMVDVGGGESFDFRNTVRFLPTFSGDKGSIHCDEYEPEYNRQHL